MNNLPTNKQIKKLTIRAMLAYASRCTRRMFFVLKGTIKEELYEKTLSMAEQVAYSFEIDEFSVAHIMEAGAEVLEGTEFLDTPEKHLAILSIATTLLVASTVLELADWRCLHKDTRLHFRAFAAKEAGRVARRVSHVLDEPQASAACDAACRDYEILLKTFGEHDDVVVGDPIDLSENSILGPLM